MAEDFRTLYCDPGEDFGWCVGRGFKLLSAGTSKMWDFADEIWLTLTDPEGGSILDTDEYLRNGVSLEDNSGPIRRIVSEDFRIYPWKARELSWDPVRTARIIGAMTMMARIHDIEIVFQPAAIKRQAVALGAEELYYHPLRENRHQNDAIQHFTYYTNSELRGLKLPTSNEGVEQ